MVEMKEAEYYVSYFSGKPHPDPAVDERIKKALRTSMVPTRKGPIDDAIRVLRAEEQARQLAKWAKKNLLRETIRHILREAHARSSYYR